MFVFSMPNFMVLFVNFYVLFMTVDVCKTRKQSLYSWTNLVVRRVKHVLTYSHRREAQSGRGDGRRCVLPSLTAFFGAADFTSAAESTDLDLAPMCFLSVTGLLT